MRDGLSPRVRGNRQTRPILGPQRRSIPACAGEPTSPPQRPCRPAVYPRVCGGTERVGDAPDGDMGLSPRVRGNPEPADVHGVIEGSIPACAGEPTGPVLEDLLDSVYPRVCGGTGTKPKPPFTSTGLSPRVRGEPLVADASRPTPAVYPRVCGGTMESSWPAAKSWGLSPRVRGNRIQKTSMARPHRSIPACAGEPAFPCWCTAGRRVYPRVCGGTSVTLTASSSLAGLSPRVRGEPPASSCR